MVTGRISMTTSLEFHRKSSKCLNAILSSKAFDTIAYKYDKMPSKSHIEGPLTGFLIANNFNVPIAVPRLPSLNGYKMVAEYTGSQASQVSFQYWYVSSNCTLKTSIGSGKSTLMKYLYDHKDTIRYLQRWSRNARLVKASFYFWNPGEGMQKSLEGLLQSLLYHVLHACPDLAPNLCSERWNSQQPQSIDSSASWTLAEL